MNNSVIVGVLTTMCTGVLFGGLGVWRDVEVLKEQTLINKEELALRTRSADQFELFLHQMDKSISIQTESVNSLKYAVSRLEKAVFTLTPNKED